jgi:hypothetical protein
MEVGDGPSNTYVEEEHWSLVTTLAHMRVALGTCEDMWHTIRGGSPCMRTLGYKPSWKRECWTNTLGVGVCTILEEGVIMIWRLFCFGGWINPI